MAPSGTAVISLYNTTQLLGKILAVEISNKIKVMTIPIVDFHVDTQRTKWTSTNKCKLREKPLTLQTSMDI